MIRAEFYESEGKLTGFRVTGHAGFAESGQDIVCAAVSTAISLTANIITDGFFMEADVSAGDNVITCKVNSPDDRTQAVLSVLKAQLGIIIEEFPNTIKIITTEV